MVKSIEPKWLQNWNGSSTRYMLNCKKALSRNKTSIYAYMCEDFGSYRIKVISKVSISSISRWPCSSAYVEFILTSLFWLYHLHAKYFIESEKFSFQCTIDNVRMAVWSLRVLAFFLVLSLLAVWKTGMDVFPDRAPYWSSDLSGSGPYPVVLYLSRGDVITLHWHFFSFLCFPLHFEMKNDLFSENLRPYWSKNTTEENIVLRDRCLVQSLDLFTLFFSLYLT